MLLIRPSTKIAGAANRIISQIKWPPELETETLWTTSDSLAEI